MTTFEQFIMKLYNFIVFEGHLYILFKNKLLLARIAVSDSNMQGSTL